MIPSSKEKAIKFLMSLLKKNLKELENLIKENKDPTQEIMQKIDDMDPVKKHMLMIAVNTFWKDIESIYFNPSQVCYYLWNDPDVRPILQKYPNWQEWVMRVTRNIIYELDRRR